MTRTKVLRQAATRIIPNSYGSLFTVLALAILAAGVIGCRGGSVPVGDPVNFTAGTIDDQQFSTEDHRGRVLLINVFATWCTYCVEEMPELARLYNQYSDQGLSMVAVAGDGRESVDQIRAFAAQHQVPFPVIPPDKQVLNAIGGVQAFPTTLIVDQQGLVRYVIRGADIDQMEQGIQTLLKDQPASE